MNSKIIYPLLIVLFLLNIGIYFLHFNQSEEKFAYVNSRVLITKYKGMEAAQAEFQQKSSIWQANMDTLQKELNAAIEKFRNDEASMSKKEKELSNQLIQSKQREFRQYQGSIQQKAAQEDQQMTQKVYDEINAYIKDYSEKKGYKMVWAITDVGNIVHGEEALDITEEIVTGLNQAYEGK